MEEFVVEVEEEVDGIVDGADNLFISKRLEKGIEFLHDVDMDLCFRLGTCLYIDYFVSFIREEFFKRGMLGALNALSKCLSKQSLCEVPKAHNDAHGIGIPFDVDHGVPFAIET